MALIDVLLTAYNAEATLRETLDSLRAQTIADIRVIAVDDGSTDGTAQILAAYAREDARFVVVTRANGGIVEALNEGLAHCQSEFLARLDADDIALPQRFERQLAYLREHPDCVAVGTEIAHIDADGAPLSGVPHPGPVEHADPARAPGREPYVVHSTLMTRLADVRAVGGYRHCPNSEDSDLFWRLSQRGALFCLPEALCKYRVHGGSISGTLLNGRIMAVGSQLGALSALRRQRGREDFGFPRALPAELRQAQSLAAMFEIATAMIAADERDHLRIAIATKLMELAGYRDYEPDTADCAFIRAALPCARHLSAENQKEIDWYVTVTAARLVRKGLFAEAWALTPPASYPVAAARLLLSR